MAWSECQFGQNEGMLTGARAYGRPRKASAPKAEFVTPRMVPFLIVTWGLDDLTSMGEARAVLKVSILARPSDMVFILLEGGEQGTLLEARQGSVRMNGESRRRWM